MTVQNCAKTAESLCNNQGDYRQMPQRRNKTSFKKGQSGNPKGRPRLSSDRRRVRKATEDQINKCSDMLNLTKTELEAILNAGEQTILVNMFIKAVQKGDWKVVSEFLDRIVGRPKQAIDHTSSDKSMKPEFKLSYKL